MTTTIATKTDLQLLKREITAEFREEAHAIRRELNKVTVRLGSLIVIVAGLLASLKLI